MSTAITPEIVSSQSKPYPLFGDLTFRQNSFVNHYLAQNGNGTLAARLAGYPDDDNQLAVTAHRLLRNPKVILEIQRRLGKSIASADEVLETLTKHARSDLTDVLTPTGEFDFRLARRKRILKKLKVKKRYEKDSEGNLQPVIEQEYEIHDPQAALEKLGKFHKLFTDKTETEISLSDSDVDRLGDSIIRAMMEAASRKRLEAASVTPVESAG